MHTIFTLTKTSSSLNTSLNKQCFVWLGFCSYTVSLFVCMYRCRIYGGWKKTLGVFLYHYMPYSQEIGVSLILQLII